MAMYVRLTQIREGEVGTVVDIRGGSGIRQRLLGIGITPGIKIWVIKAGRPGPYIIAIGNMRLAIGYGAADKIIIRRET